MSALRRRAAAIQETGQEYLGQVGSILVEAAEQSDSPGGLGINERIDLGHTLVDLWIKGSISIAQAMLTNPAGARFQSLADCRPLPPDPISVAPRPYARRISVESPFRRVGLPHVVLPRSSFRFEPSVLEANETELRIVLLEYSRIGANYIGKVKLTPVISPGVLSATEKFDEPEVTVGL